jgi:hypothetical protein
VRSQSKILHFLCLSLAESEVQLFTIEIISVSNVDVVVATSNSKYRFIQFVGRHQMSL